MRRNLEKVSGDVITLFGTDCFATDYRIDKSTIPAGYYAYELRSNGDENGGLTTLERSVMVDFAGTAVFNKPVFLSPAGFREIRDSDYVMLDCDVDFSDFREDYPPETKRGG